VSYLVDSDVMIDAKNRHYPFDVCPGFWDWLVDANANGLVYSVAKVREELCAQEDELTKWAKAHDDFFLDVDSKTAMAMGDVATWVTTRKPEYIAAARAEFLDAADYYLVSHAKAHGFVVVTAEVPADTVNKVKIPNACKELQVAYTDVFSMLKTQGARFVKE
jgi:hypothetical protein